MKFILLLGILAVGALADQLGASTAVMIMSSIGIVLMAVAGLYWPELAKLRDV